MSTTKAALPEALRVIRAIDRLEAGPARIDRRRLAMPVAVRRDGEVSRTELVYKYEEDVFEVGDPASEQLAGMIGVQALLNYGLFCNELRFAGAFTRADRAFIERYTGHTAREIYVNKLLAPNEFLTDTTRELPAVEHPEKLIGTISFVDAPAEDGPAWDVDPARHAVLSSGGKDSLVSYGILEEIGAHPHAIFVNESGRHWYTALNAYRRLAAERSGVHRVWTNSDRYFAWMLRRLPFVRQDFARRRADEYPIRLWTVAVFLFGALPVMRRHGIGRLVIGNEFDTTVRRTREGIPHHAGLYDQSRPFDNAMTRYFVARGWGVRQFSILRQLSEILIEKVLVERYPELLADQLSCHAASLRAGRAVPCGKCEKCRRIVGMLCALGAEPGRCGYSEQQSASCLAALVRAGVHQERPGAEHLAHMLTTAGVIEGDSPAFPARPHPEILKLRFHPQASPFDAIPNDIRPGVQRILLQHAEGAVERRGGHWVACDPMQEQRLRAPYTFDAPARRTSGASVARRAQAHLLAEMTWPEAEARFRESDIALLPVGAIEQHGPHLPLDTDTYDADYLARRVAAACRAPQPLVLPVIPYGVSYHHEDFAGTFSVSPETLSRMVHEIGMSAARNGVTKLIIINGHGGNGPALHLAAQTIDRDARIFTCVDSGETSDHDIYDLLDAPNDVHAGEIETSTTLAARPELVRMDKAPRMVPRFSSSYLDFTSKRSVGWYARTAKISSSGVLGDATKATREKGERIWELMTQRLVELVQDLQGLSLDEIYQKRY